MPRPFTYSMVLSEHRGTWSATMNYFAGDMCDYQSIIWICLKKHTNITPVEGTYWHLFNTYPLTPVLTRLTVNDISDFIRSGYIAAYFKTILEATTGLNPVIRCRAYTSDDMTNDFGTGIEFSIQDATSTENVLGRLGFSRVSSDNTGYFAIHVSHAGVSNSRLVINPYGDVCLSGYPSISESPGLDINGKILRIRNSKTPASATATGNAGEICWDANYVYICIATNTWHRFPHSTW